MRLEIKKKTIETSFEEKLKVAIVHEPLVQIGGAENVLYELKTLFKNSTVFTPFYDNLIAKKVLKETCNIRSSFLQKIPFIKKNEQFSLPFLPFSYETFDFSEFDLVISNCSGFSKNLIIPDKTRFIAYVHSPARFLWHDKDRYLGNLNGIKKVFSPLVKIISPKLRIKDFLSVERADLVCGNSNHIVKRIKKYYKVKAETLYPPVEIKKSLILKKKDNFYLAGGRLVAYKRFDLLVESFNDLELPLKIFGSGPEIQKLNKIKRSDKIELLGSISSEEKERLFLKAKAFVFPQVEDFGIVPLEAISFGCPVIAFKKGGAIETIEEGVNGIFFKEQTKESLTEKILEFEKGEISFEYEKFPQTVLKFSKENFRKNVKKIVERIMEIS